MLPPGHPEGLINLYMSTVMLPEDQQRILGYFIEEARDHLRTIEQGLVNLQSTVNDTEMMNELFRAAHSVKGGAAMLGLNSIHRISHRLEDFFKLLKDSGAKPDQDLESMLLKVFDALQEQVNQLQGPFGLSEAQAQAMLVELEPVFNQTEAHLNGLLSNSEALPRAISPLPVVPAVVSAHPETSALQLVFRSDVPRLLREMLGTFKGIDDPRSRQRLEQICQRLYRLGEQFDLLEWCALLDTVRQAVVNPDYTFRSLAEVIIKNLKMSQDLVLAGRSREIGPSADLIGLTSKDPVLRPGVEFITDLESTPEALDLWQHPAAGQTLPSLSNGSREPQMASAELNSLADLFESQETLLDSLWQEESPQQSMPAPIEAEAAGLNQGGSFLDQELVDWLTSETAQPSPDSLTGEAAADLDSLSAILDDFTATWLDDGQDFNAGPESALQPESSGLVPSLETANGLAELRAAALAAGALDSQELEGELPQPGSELGAEVDHDFGDLEKLLEAANQIGGPGPTSAGRRRFGAPNQRLPRPSIDQTMRVAVSNLDNLANLVGELVVNRNSLEQDQDRLRQSLDKLLHQVQQLNDVGQRMRNLYERSLLESTLMTNRRPFDFAGSGVPSGHATGVTFDALEMDRFTDFHTLSQEMIELIVRVRESSSDIEITIDSTEQVARQFRQVTTQLQEGLNKARMVPFGQTVNHLPRAIRDISLKCGREARLVVEGEDTLIDQMLVERLYDPLIHLVNNALTHGIESPEDRLAAGKARQGTITIRAFYQGNQTVIYIADDGNGIDPAAVKAKALEQGLITSSEAHHLSTAEIYDLLFLPQFTTRDRADAFSGRGVGLDVVNTALRDIRGSIAIESEIGRGTSFTIRLPLTLSITKALSCLNNQALIAFPMDGVEDMVDVPRADLYVDQAHQMAIPWRGGQLPLWPLGTLLKFNRSLGRGRVYGGPQDDSMVSVIVLRSTTTCIGLQVDQVIGEQEIVIKQLEGPVPKPTGIAGATVLGDGRVMPIADVLELIDLATGRIRSDSLSSLWTQPLAEVPGEIPQATEPTVLIVDDSITVRELLSVTFNKVGYRVEQARDGQEALAKLRSGLPCDLVFCDIEMPRMDGLELLSRMQQDPTLSQIPVAMLTSRGADRHRQMALDLGAKAYFTKPYLEEVLLEAAQQMLAGKSRHLSVGP